MPPHLPIQNLFNKLDQPFSQFYMGWEIPRIRKEFLQKNRSDRGLALPKFLYYYWAANAQKIIFWMHSLGGTDWDETATSLQALITSGLPIKIAQQTPNPVVHFTLKIWTHQHLKLRQTLFIQYAIIMHSSLQN